MLLKTKGTPVNVLTPIVGRVTRDPGNVGEHSIFIADEGNIPPRQGFRCAFSIDSTSLTQSAIINIPDLNHLNDGDIVVANEDGNINTLYRVNSYHNVLLATERCNSNCLMCSQPPKDKNDVPRLFNINSQLIPLIPKDCIELGISGGEPTLMGDHFFDLLALIKAELPETEVHLLTNGRSFAWHNMAERLAGLEFRRLMLGIPVYADYYQVHDYIVQAENAFNQTMLGVYNLARYNQRIEIRIVVHKLSIPRLTRLAKYIYKNLPFVEHVAFMGLEYIGYTPHNIDKLWIEPYDYMNELGEAVEFLAGQGMHVSIYNTQLCVLPERLWQFARKSISDWKNSYLPECNICTKLNDCGGLFTWNLKKHSSYIKAFIK